MTGTRLGLLALLTLTACQESPPAGPPPLAQWEGTLPDWRGGRVPVASGRGDLLYESDWHATDILNADGSFAVTMPSLEQMKWYQYALPFGPCEEQALARTNGLFLYGIESFGVYTINSFRTHELRQADEWFGAPAGPMVGGRSTMQLYATAAGEYRGSAVCDGSVLDNPFRYAQPFRYSADLRLKPGWNSVQVDITSVDGNGQIAAFSLSTPPAPPSLPYRLYERHYSDFVLTLRGNVVTTTPGQIADLNVGVSSQGGYAGTLTLHLEGVPAGVSLWYTTTTIEANSASMLFNVVSVAANTPRGVYPARIVASGRGATHWADFSLVIR